MKRAVRFVHRPLSDVPNEPKDGEREVPYVREPLISRPPTSSVPVAKPKKTGWFGTVLSRLVGSVWWNRQNVSGRKLDPQRWLPKD